MPGNFPPQSKQQDFKKRTAGRRWSVTAQNPESGTIGDQYDPNGNLISKSDARSITTSYVYDALNRVTQRAYSDSTLPVFYTYDDLPHAKGKLTKVTTGSGSTPFSVTEYTEFDAVGRVKKSRQTTDGTVHNEMEYTYNLSGALVEQKYPSGRVVRNVLDNDGDLSMVQSKRNANHGYWNYAHHFTYTAAGAVASMQLGNGAWEKTAFNSRLQPTRIALGRVPNATDLLKLDYTYGNVVNGQLDTTKNNGNIQSQTITVPTVGSSTGFTAVQTYAYDSLNRIDDATEMVTPAGSTTATLIWRQDYSFDRYGNRNFVEANTTTIPKNCGTSPNFTVCAADRKVFNPSISASTNRINLDQDGDSVNDYAFDAAGNTTRDAQFRKFTYDAENKQTKVESVDANGNVTGILGQYSYDGDGRRVKKHVPSTGETTVFVYDASSRLVAEYSTIQNPTPQVAYLTNDHLGSPRINTNENGVEISRHDYRPYGEEITDRTHAQYARETIRKQFTGYERDNETDIDFAENRYYNFNHGRFTTTDPLLESGRIGDPQTWNRYAYVLNNPLNYVDPDGLYECTGSADECRDFRKNLASAYSDLTDIQIKYGEDSDEYKKAKKALDSYGCESKGGNCLGVDGKPIEIGKDDKGNSIYLKDTASNVQVSFDWTGTSPASTSADTGTGIVKVQFGKGNDSNLGLIANEGINSADFQSALKTGTSVSLYQSEKDGLFVQAVFGEFRAAGRGSTYAYFNLTQGQVNYWERSWESPDHKAVRAGRESAINKVLTDVYKLSPTDTKPLLTIPKGYKPRK